ncbi:MAG: thioredoxin-disulfide reductase [Candidatus Shikimatogenerans bostrichidophilus]|nr:MAG: thioredoxin-disulfide reductase [Candidatus Shikimatogenerans bostrichidophilus]
MKIIDCVIIGSGPAGYSAAIYLARYNIKHLIYTGDIPGGQLINTTIVDNYPGFSKGILGINLMNEMYKQAIKYGTIVKYNKIIKVFFLKKKKLHYLYTNNKKKIITKTVIIATGSLPKTLKIKSLNNFLGYGISYCATCDGMIFKNKNVAVIGGGNKALEESILLSKICKKVYLIIRNNKFKAYKILINIINKIKNIKILFNYIVIKFLGNKKLKYINLFNKIKNKIKKKKVSGVFIAIGNYPNTSIFKNKIKMDKNGYIITKNKTTKTNIPGIFAAGDVQDKIYKQAITSAGSGCMAAFDVEKYLYYNKYK